MKEKIANSFLIKEHALKALEYKADDASVMHMLGKWCYNVANIGWLERTAASALFASPPTSTYLYMLSVMDRQEWRKASSGRREKREEREEMV